MMRQEPKKQKKKAARFIMHRVVFVRTGSRVVTSMHAWVQVDRGVVKKINWDKKAKSFCGESQRIGDFCSKEHSQCQGGGGDIDCDLKV